MGCFKGASKAYLHRNEEAEEIEDSNYNILPI